MNRSGSGGGNQLSSNAILGGDGRTVLFQSFASDLAAGITLDGDQAWAVDAAASPASQRFYRVVALP